MPPRINNEGEYTDEETVAPDGSLVPYTAEEIDATRDYEAAHNIPSTLPADADEVVVTEDEAAVLDDESLDA